MLFGQVRLSRAREDDGHAFAFDGRTSRAREDDGSGNSFPRTCKMTEYNANGPVYLECCISRARAR